MHLITLFLAHDIASRPRRKRFHANRVLLIFCGGMVALCSLLLQLSAGSSATGLYLFRNLAMSSLVAICLLATLSSAAVFIRERSQSALALLFLTDVGTCELLLGKLLASLFFTSLAALSFLPLFLMLVGMGGVIALQIVAAYALLFCTAFLCSCMGLVVSSLVRTERGMRFLSGVALCIVFLVLPGTVMVLCSLMSIASSPVLATVSPFRALALTTDVRNLAHVPWNCLFDLGLGALFLLTTYRILRTRRHGADWLSVQQQGLYPETISSHRGRAKNRLLSSPNPVTWRDVNFSYGDHSLARVVFLLICCVSAVCIAVGYLALVRFGNTKLFASMGSVIAGLTAIPATVFLFGSVFYCSQAFSVETRFRILDLLLITDLSVEDIFLGKFFAVLRALSPWMICTVAGVCALLCFGGSAVAGGSVVFFGDYLSMCLAYPFLALSLSLRFRRAVALAICMAVFILWNIVGRVLVILLLARSSLVSAGFVADFAFHAELVLIGSVYMERVFRKMEESGATWIKTDEVTSK